MSIFLSFQDDPAIPSLKLHTFLTIWKKEKEQPFPSKQIFLKKTFFAGRLFSMAAAVWWRFFLQDNFYLLTYWIEKYVLHHQILMLSLWIDVNLDKNFK